MALSNQEKIRRHRERKRTEEAQSSIEAAAGKDVFRTPFFEFVRTEISDGPQRAGNMLLMAGLTPPVFDDDSGLLENTFDPEIAAILFHAATNSLARAEIMVDLLQGATIALAESVSAYKKTEIKQRLQEIEERDLSDPEVKKAALQEATRLNKMLDQLDKQVRITFPQWKVTG